MSNTKDSTFKNDLFISYAHIDNWSLTQESGWVSNFHEHLAAMLAVRLGSKVNIWRDKKLQGNDVFGNEIVERFRDAALFVSVLTPPYLNSQWCTKEIHEFCEVARNTYGLVIANKIRVFKVIKMPVPTQDSLPEEVQDVLGYQFYTFDEEDHPMELDPAYGKEVEQAYLRKLNALAWEIASFLQMIEEDETLGLKEKVNGTTALAEVEEVAPDHAEPTTAAKTASSKPVVYLAECGRDRRDEREILLGELKDHGYTVLPEKEMPEIEEDYIAEVERLMNQCKLSIHLVGSSYGQVPDGLSLKSNVILQNEVAVKKSQAGVLQQRLIWLPQGTTSQQPHQQAFIEAISADAEVQTGADVITGSIENLKAEIHKTLKQIARPEAEPSAEPGEAPETRRKMIYLICNEQDRKNTIPVRKYLKSKGFDVKIPLFSGDAATVRQAQKDYLTHCDAVILYDGVGDEAWKYSKVNELQKMKAYRNGSPMPVRYTYLAEPVTEAKEELIEFEEPNLINGLHGFSEAEMEAFLQAVNQR